ncbi:dockerin type I repeat-containing protein [Roseateles oligotrophus]|uniref:Dockerin type I repeat-containing protein n=1 Tax=Roseateles oligotrophus TaxID=1769250 RepID=A0ABT2YLJ8_9BURK|nr:dockerin type I repeat-containing protein [Roseateles oligotrophus]MCV2370938.1 dockerin type I repeat-containing protein [Roseateles oligotrophus]
MKNDISPSWTMPSNTHRSLGQAPSEGGRSSAPRIAILSMALACGAATAGSVTYTLDSQFDLGVLQNVNHNAPNNNQLQLNVIGGGFPILWVANAGERTLSKFDTTQQAASPGREVARYYTWFSNEAPTNYAWSGPAPSRTAVDIDGNAYILNRHFDGRSAVLIKILANGFIDRNGNGVVDSSFDANNDGVIQAAEMKGMLDTNNNGVIDCPASAPFTACEIQDERIAWAKRVPDGVAAPLRSGQLGRSLCMGTDGNLWVGLYSDGTYYKVSGVDGHTISGPISVPNVSPYGCLIDKDGTLWSASLGSYMGKVTNTQSNSGPYLASSFYHGAYGSNYGIALGKDAGDGHTLVYLGGTGYSYLRFDSNTNSFSVPAAMFTSSLGVNVDGSGNILVSKSSGGISKFSPTGALIYDRPAQAGTASDSRGIMPDANNDIWQIHLGASKISKFKGETEGAVLGGTALGTLPTGNSPYTYSDASGFASANITVQTGTWNVTQDGGASGTLWGTVGWNAVVPAGASVTVKVRIADTQAALQGQSFFDVSNGTPFNTNGRYIETQVRLTASPQGLTPIVQDVTIASADVANKCDVNGDGSIDSMDINAIMAGRGQTVPPGNAALDIDGNGVINVNDARACTLKCSKPKCAP